MDPHLWWHVARASGLTAWLLLSASVLWGLLLSTRVLGNRPAPSWLLDLHRLLGALTVVFVGVHMLGLLLDKWIGYGITELLVPLRSEYRPWAVAWGIVTMYLLIAIAVTSWLRPRIPDPVWRWIHRAAFVAFVASTLHLLQAGTDRHNRYLLAAVAAVALAFVFLSAYRVLAGRRPPEPRRETAPTPPASRSLFHPLTVSDVRTETADSVSVAFEVPANLADTFRFDPGQFLTLRTRINEVELRRPYSICSGIADGELRIAIRRADAGSVSGWITSEVVPGTVIDVSPPQGRFTTLLNPLRSRRVLGIAAGSGITPVISILRSILAIEPGSTAVLLLGNRDAASVMLQGEIARVAAQAAGRLTVVHLYSRAADAEPRQRGRIDAARLKDPDMEELDFGRFDEAFLCGPETMMTKVREFLEATGMPAGNIHAETFHAAQRRDGTEIPRDRETLAPPVELTLVVAGTATTISTSPGETVLEAGLRIGLDLPYSCLSGACGTCVARIVRGACDTGSAELTAEEKANGTIRTCSAVPTEPGTWVEFSP